MVILIRVRHNLENFASLCSLPESLYFNLKYVQLFDVNFLNSINYPIYLIFGIVIYETIRYDRGMFKVKIEKGMLP